MIDILLRGPNPKDSSFLLDSWIREERDKFPNNLVDKAIFYEHYKEIVKVLISKSMVLLAVNPEDTDQIYGYLVFEKNFEIPIIHFLYVKLVFRENGIATQLIKSIFPNFQTEKTIITHVPRARKDIPTKQSLIKFNLRYDPFIIQRRLNTKEK